MHAANIVIVMLIISRSVLVVYNNELLSYPQVGTSDVAYNQTCISPLFMFLRAHKRLVTI